MLGLGFLGGQAFEYTNLIRNEGFTITSGIYGTVFYSLTGLHGLHVTAGVVVLTGVLVRALMGHFSSTRSGSRCTSRCTRSDGGREAEKSKVAGRARG